MAKAKIDVQGKEIRIIKGAPFDYVCLSDIAKAGGANPNDTLKNYLRNKSNINFLGIWESVHNENFNEQGFKDIKFRTGDNNFTLSVTEWIKKTNACGMKSQRGKYGGTYAHEEIAIQFATWFSPEFYVYFIKAFKNLAAAENRTAQFFLDKIFDNTLESNQLAKDLQQLLLPPKDNKAKP